MVFGSCENVNRVSTCDYPSTTHTAGHITVQRKESQCKKRGLLQWLRDVSQLCLYLWCYLFKSAHFPDAKGSIREIILPKGLDLDRPKRTRTSFTAEQLYRLEMEFQRCQYVVGRERTELARQLNLSETQVRNTFKQSSFFLLLCALNGMLNVQIGFFFF